MKRSEKQLGLLSFFARAYPNDKCGSNGLPLTPNSIRIYGRFQCLKALRHSFLCRYIDIERGGTSPERLFIISEQYSLNLNELLNDTYIYNLIMSSNTNSIVVKWFYQLLRAFDHLSQQGIVHRHLSLRQICVQPDSNVKLNNYGLYHMSECGFCVSFPIANLSTMAPECLLLEYLYGNKFSECPANNNVQHVELENQKFDVWSLGAVLFQFVFGLSETATRELLEQDRVLLHAAKCFTGSFESGYSYLLKLYEINTARQLMVEQRTRPFLLKFMNECLTLDPIKRPGFSQLVQTYEQYLNVSTEFKHLLESEEDSFDSLKWNLFNGLTRSSYLPNNRENDEYINQTDKTYLDHLWKRDVDEIYYLWRLAGGDCQATMIKNGRTLSKLRPIQKLAAYTRVEDGHEYGKLLDAELLFDDTIVPISLEQLCKRLSTVKLEFFYPLNTNEFLEEEVRTSRTCTTTSLDTELKLRYFDSLNNPEMPVEDNTSLFIKSMQKQPLNIRESDTEYQFHRMIKFSRYLVGLPYKTNSLLKECLIDIPPLYRAASWCALLVVSSVSSDLTRFYSRINKEITTQTDRQIDVDVPRCHQYDPLMASPQAHYKLKRVLKAWVLSNPHLVYWQGLDSLCAPFLYLNFNSEQLAYACLNNFVNKYAANFFLKDNSAVIHEYLAVFSHLIAFHDAELAAHFELIEFRPDLYAIPWFLTMFAHVFPLYKIVHLWDTLLLGSSAFPLCIGVAILAQLTPILLHADFNECILLFSELPEINIAKCVADAIEIFSVTPSSCLYRQHAVNANSISPVVSNTGLDYVPVELAELRAQMCARVSARDLVDMYDTNRLSVLVLDVRPPAEFAKFYISNSVNVPFESVNLNRITQLLETSQLLSGNEADPTQYLSYLVQSNRSAVKVVLASQDRLPQAIELANCLVRAKISRVCLLNGGIECLNKTKIVQRQI